MQLVGIFLGQSFIQAVCVGGEQIFFSTSDDLVMFLWLRGSMKTDVIKKVSRLRRKFAHPFRVVKKPLEFISH